MNTYIAITIDQADRTGHIFGAHVNADSNCLALNLLQGNHKRMLHCDTCCYIREFDLVKICLALKVSSNQSVRNTHILDAVLLVVISNANQTKLL